MSRLHQVLRSFSDADKTYDASGILQAFVAERLAERVLHGQPSSLGNVLEIGCGTGFLSRHLVDSADFYALTDLSLPLLTQARGKVPHAHVTPLVVDGEKLCFTASFDLIVSNLALHWFQDPKAALNQWVASLKPGGVLYVTLFGNNSFHEWRTAHHLAEAPCGLLDFASFGQLKDWLPLTGHRSVEEEWVTVPVDKALTLLRTWKSTGSHLSHPGHKPLPSPTLKKVMRLFDQDPQISCQILYGYYKKSEKMQEE